MRSSRSTWMSIPQESLRDVRLLKLKCATCAEGARRTLESEPAIAFAAELDQLRDLGRLVL